MDVKIGEIMIAQEDVTYQNENAKRTVNKGDKSIIGFDKAIHLLKERIIILPDDEFNIEGYSAHGLSEFLGVWLDNCLDLEEKLKNKQCSIEDIKLCIYDALVELGMEAKSDED